MTMGRRRGGREKRVWVVYIPSGEAVSCPVVDALSRWWTIGTEETVELATKGSRMRRKPSKSRCGRWGCGVQIGSRDCGCGVVS